MKTNMAVEDYMDEITLTYYCFNVVLAIVFFAYGTYYLKKRDKRDELRREWRQFAETVDREYSKLKDENTHQRVLEIKESLGNVKVCNEITGVDVLSYMIHHCADRPRFRTRGFDFDAFRDDLNKILRLLRICHSLIRQLGTVPDDIKEEVGELVTDLGEVTLPFFKGHRRKIILKCLEHFGSQSPSENSVTDTDMRNAIPYVDFLVFTWVFKAPGANSGKKVKETKDKCPECVAFTLHVNGPLTCVLDEETRRELLQELNVLIQLQQRIVGLKFLTVFVGELRPKWCNLFSDECPVNDVSVVLRVLHEVRGYIYSKVKREEINAGKQRKIEVFRTVYRDIIELRLIDWEAVLDICQTFKADLSNLEKSKSDYHRNTTFREEFSDLYLKYVKVVDPSGKMVETHI